MHHIFALFLALLHFLVRQSSEYVIVGETYEKLASRMVSAWSNRAATGAMYGILAAKALPSLKAARDVLIALIVTSFGGSTCPDETELRSIST